TLLTYTHSTKHAAGFKLTWTGAETANARRPQRCCHSLARLRLDWPAVKVKENGFHIRPRLRSTEDSFSDSAGGSACTGSRGTPAGRPIALSAAFNAAGHVPIPINDSYKRVSAC